MYIYIYTLRDKCSHKVNVYSEHNMKNSREFHLVLADNDPHNRQLDSIKD